MLPEVIRLTKFRKLKKEVRGSKKHLLIGIDVAKTTHNAFFGTATGQTLSSGFVFENSKQGFEKLLNEVSAIKAKAGLSDIVFGLEPTANYHKPLGEYLLASDQDLVLVAGTAVKNNRELLDGRWDKNDRKDAANVADLISQGKFLYYENPCSTIRELRDLLSLKRKMKRQEQGLRVRIRNNLLAQYFPEMDSYYRTCERDNLAIMRNCLSPIAISSMHYQEFFKAVVSRRNGLRQEKHLYRIWQLAQSSIGCKASFGAECAASVLVEQLQSTRAAVEQIDDTVLKLCRSFPEYAYLTTIPGFGPDISAKVLAYIGDHNRFESSRQVLKMAGFDLSASRSGKSSLKAQPVISKKGKADLRYGLYQAALIASIHTTGLKHYFDVKIQDREKEKGIKTKMRVKLAAKMLVIAWTLMRNKTPFNPKRMSVN